MSLVQTEIKEKTTIPNAVIWAVDIYVKTLIDEGYSWNKLDSQIMT